MTSEERAAVPSALSASFLSRLPRALTEPSRPIRAIFVGWLLAFIPSIMLSALVRGLLPAVEQPDFTIDTLTRFALVTVFAPVTETLVMAAALAILLTFLKPAQAVVASSIGWGIAHSLMAPAWGLVIWWPFLVFSALFVTWRERSLIAALAIPMAVHGLQNSLPALLLMAQARG